MGGTLGVLVVGHDQIIVQSFIGWCDLQVPQVYHQGDAGQVRADHTQPRRATGCAGNGSCCLQTGAEKVGSARGAGNAT